MRVAWLKDLRMADLDKVGGKNASLGEMIGALSAAGIRVPGGFATTAEAFREFLAVGGLAGKIEKRLASLDPNDVVALAACGKEIRSWIVQAPFPAELERDIKSYFQKLESETSKEVSWVQVRFLAQEHLQRFTHSMVEGVFRCSPTYIKLLDLNTDCLPLFDALLHIDMDLDPSIRALLCQG